MNMTHDIHKSSFTLLSDKYANTNVVLCSWCSTMDLLALTTNMNHVIVYRLSWQKIFDIHIMEYIRDDGHDYHDHDDDKCVISGITWEPSGKSLVVGLINGEVIVFSLESGKPLYRHRLSKVTIPSLQWIRYETPASSSSTTTTTTSQVYAMNASMFENVDRVTKFCACVPPPPSKPPRFGMLLSQRRTQDDKATLTTITTHNDNEYELTVLYVGTSDGCVLAYAWGWLLLARIPIVKGDDVCSVARLESASDLSHVCAIVQHGDSLSVCVVNTSVLSECRLRVLVSVKQLGRLSDLCKYVEDCTNNIKSRWVDCQRAVQRKFSGLSDLLEQHALNSTPQDALLTYVLTGLNSDVVEQFFSQYLSVSSLRRMSEGVNDVVKSVCRILNENVLPAAEELVVRASDFRGLARCGENFSKLGITVELCSALVKAGQQIIACVEEVRVRVSKIGRRYGACFRWLMAQIDRVESGSVVFHGDPNDISLVISCFRDDLFTDHLEHHFSGESTQQSTTNELLQVCVPGLSLMKCVDDFRSALNALIDAPCVAFTPLCTVSFEYPLCSLDTGHVAIVPCRTPRKSSAAPSPAPLQQHRSPSPQPSPRSHTSSLSGVVTPVRQLKPSASYLSLVAKAEKIVRSVAVRYNSGARCFMLAFLCDATDERVAMEARVCVVRVNLCGTMDASIFNVPAPLVHRNDLNVSTGSSSSLLYQDVFAELISVVDIVFYDDCDLYLLVRYAPRGVASRAGVHSYIYAIDYGEGLRYSKLDLSTSRQVVSMPIDSFDTLAKRERQIAHVQGRSLSVCSQRGVGSVVAGTRRIIMYDLRNDEMDDDDDEEEEEEEDDDAN